MSSAAATLILSTIGASGERSSAEWVCAAGPTNDLGQGATSGKPSCRSRLIAIDVEFPVELPSAVRHDRCCKPDEVRCLPWQKDRSGRLRPVFGHMHGGGPYRILPAPGRPRTQSGVKVG